VILIDRRADAGLPHLREQAFGAARKPLPSRWICIAEKTNGGLQ
jgi:hypothetical protein